MKRVDIGTRFRCKRIALGWSYEKAAEVLGSSATAIKAFEGGAFLTPDAYQKVWIGIEDHIRGIRDKTKYLSTRIVEETMLLQLEPSENHVHTLSHLQIHVAKLNMAYLNETEGGWE